MTEVNENVEETMAGILSEMTGLRETLVELIESQHDGMIDRKDTVAEVAAAFSAVSERASSVLEDSREICNELMVSIKDKEKYTKQIESLRTMRTMVFDLIELDKHVCRLKALVDADFELEVQSIHAISKEMVAVQSLISQSKETLQCTDVYKAIIRNLYEIKIELKDNLETIWYSNVIINRTDKNPFFNYTNPHSNEDLIPTSKSITFDLDIALIREIIYLMFQVQIGYKHMKYMMKFICNELIYPTIEDCLKFCLSTSVINNKISIALNSKATNGSLISIDQANMFLDNLTFTLKVIYENFLCIANTDENDVQRMNLIIGVQKEFFDKSLTKALLTTFILKIYDIHQQLSSKLSEFNEFLIKYKFIDHSNMNLKEYLDNFDSHFRESEAYSMLTNCRKLCLLPILVFGKKVCSSNMTKINDDENLTSLLSNFSKYIDLESLLFPECNVSELVMDLVRYVTDYIDYFDVKTENDSQTVVDTLKILPDILMMYHNVVPISNQDVLNDIPQASAIHYNNYIYIAHKCMIMSPSLKNIVEASIKTFTINDLIEQILLNNVPTSMLTIIYTMYNAANDTICNESDKQKEQLNEFFEEMDTFMNFGNNKAKIQKSFKKCYLYLHSLSEAYAVFPERIYEAFFGGFLINYVLIQVIEMVLKMSDIVLSDNKEIITTIITLQTNLLSIISEHYRLQICDADKKDPEMFMIEYVPIWEKTKSLLFILNGSLMDIDDRYLNGKGALSLHFSGQEMKALIKALFKHSPLRTKVLENIH